MKGYQLENFFLLMLNFCRCDREVAVCELNQVIFGDVDKPCSVFFVNGYCANIYAQNLKYRNAVKKANLVYPDGIAVKLVGYLKGLNLAGNLSGTDVIPAFLRKNNGNGHSVFLLGAEEDVVSRAADNFPTLFPGWRVVGYRNGYFTRKEEKYVVNQIKTNSPDLLLVGMGTPLQELWISNHLEELDVPLCIAVGGLFKYWGSGLKRAPTILQNLFLEWFWLLVNQPKRLNKCLHTVNFLGRAIASCILIK